jgi:hypothetical protein
MSDVAVVVITGPRGCRVVSTILDWCEIEGSVVTLALLHAVADATLSLNLTVTIDIAIALKVAIAVNVEIIMNAIVTKGFAMVTALGIRKD